ncbi:MAG: radical SAM protein, partial [Phycisphaerae bacterium]
MDIGLYVHVPFCATKCGYCDFYSHVPAPGAFGPLVDALLAELDAGLAREGLRVETIFVGGGTPTLLPLVELERLFSRLGQVA